MTKFAPLPEFARGPEIPYSGYRVTDLGGGAYGITSGLVNTMFLVTKKGVVVVDAPPDLGGKLMAGIEDVTPKPITHLIYSHAHADHIGSARLLARDGVTILAHEGSTSTLFCVCSRKFLVRAWPWLRARSRSSGLRKRPVPRCAPHGHRASVPRIKSRARRITH